MNKTEETLFKENKLLKEQIEELQRVVRTLVEKEEARTFQEKEKAYREDIERRGNSPVGFP